jgi:hypothetical protein
MGDPSNRDVLDWLQLALFLVIVLHAALQAAIAAAPALHLA